MVPTKLKLFKLKMKQSKTSQVVSHLDSSKSEICAVKFSKMFLASHKEKNLILKIRLL